MPEVSRRAEKSPNRLMLPLWSSRNKLNLSLFALILKLLLHEPMIRAVIWRRRHLGCWIICAQGCIHSVWSHPLWTLWRLQTWPDSESVSLSRDIASLCTDIFVRGKYQRAGSGMENCFVCFYGFMWMSLNVSAVGWMTIHLPLRFDVFFPLTLQCWQMEMITDYKANDARRPIFQHRCASGILWKLSA